MLNRPEVKLANGKERQIPVYDGGQILEPGRHDNICPQFVERLFGQLPEFFKDENQLVQLWGEPATRKALLVNLSEKGFGATARAELAEIINAEKSDVSTCCPHRFCEANRDAAGTRRNAKARHPLEV